MANPLLIVAAIVVPVLVVGLGGGYWLYSADRVVDEGTAGEYAWQVRRVDMKYIAEVKTPAATGFAPEGFKAVPAPAGNLSGPVELWDTPEQAKAKALEFIAIAAAAAVAAAGAASEAASTIEPAITLTESTVALEMEPPVLTVSAVSPVAAFVAGV